MASRRQSGSIETAGVNGLSDDMFYLKARSPNFLSLLNSANWSPFIVHRPTPYLLFIIRVAKVLPFSFTPGLASGQFSIQLGTSVAASLPLRPGARVLYSVGVGMS